MHDIDWRSGTGLGDGDAMRAIVEMSLWIEDEALCEVKETSVEDIWDLIDGVWYWVGIVQ